MTPHRTSRFFFPRFLSSLLIANFALGPSPAHALRPMTDTAGLEEAKVSVMIQELSSLLGFEMKADFLYFATSEDAYQDIFTPLFDLVLKNRDFRSLSIEGQIEWVRYILKEVESNLISQENFLSLFTKVWDDDYEQKGRLEERLENAIKHIRENLIGFHPAGQRVKAFRSKPLPAGITFEVAREGEFDSILQFRRREFVPKVELENEGKAKGWLRSLLRSGGRAPGFVMVARENSEIVGYVTVDRFIKDQPGYLIIDEMTVAEELQQIGIGTHLLQSAVNLALEKYSSLKEIRLHDSSKKSGYAIGKMAKRLGFSSVGRGWLVLEVVKDYVLIRKEIDERIARLIDLIGKIDASGGLSGLEEQLARSRAA